MILKCKDKFKFNTFSGCSYFPVHWFVLGSQSLMNLSQLPVAINPTDIIKTFIITILIGTLIFGISDCVLPCNNCKMLIKCPKKTMSLTLNSHFILVDGLNEISSIQTPEMYKFKNDSTEDDIFIMETKQSFFSMYCIIVS